MKYLRFLLSSNLGTAKKKMSVAGLISEHSLLNVTNNPTTTHTEKVTCALNQIWKFNQFWMFLLVSPTTPKYHHYYYLTVLVFSSERSCFKKLRHYLVFTIA